MILVTNAQFNQNCQASYKDFTLMLAMKFDLELLVLWPLVKGAELLHR